jgi:lipoyl(octanoyl) transferase
VNREPPTPDPQPPTPGLRNTANPAADAGRSGPVVGGSQWYLLDSGPGQPAFNMALDEALLEAMPRLQTPALRFYAWTEPAASFGYLQKYSDVERLTPLRPLVRRPTGGGLVPHASDWTYSLVFPVVHAWYSLSALESYRRVHEWIQSAFARLDVATELAPDRRKAGPGQCFEGFETSDLLWHGRKIAGAAQRRRRDGLLIQGSVQPPPSLNRADWHQAMCEAGHTASGTAWIRFEPDSPVRERAGELVARKYSLAGYNQKR